MKPTAEQDHVIRYPLEPLRVVAGAGTGKTMTMALRIAHLVEHHGVEPEQALGITFTNKAAGELSSRVRLSLPEHTAAGNEVEILTYHGFALGLLREFGPYVGVPRDVRLIPAGYVRHLLREAAGEAGGRHLDLTSPGHRVDELARLSSELGDHLLGPGDLAEEGGDDDNVWQVRHDMARVLEAYGARKAGLGVVDFADLITLAHRLVQDPDVAERVRNRYRIVLLDEYQDTNPSQRELLRSIFSEGFPVTAVGDSDQTIYEWRGASPDNFDDFGTHFPGRDGAPARSLVLSVNWRSARRIVEVANAVRSNIGKPSALERLEARPSAPTGTVTAHWLRTSLDEADWIARRMGRMHELGRPWSDMAVLFRKHRHMAAVRDALADHGIPVEVASLGGLLQVPEVADLHAWLRILARPDDSAALGRILLGSSYRLGLTDLAPLARWARARSRLDQDSPVGWALLEAVDDLEGVTGLSGEARRRLGAFRSRYRQLLELAQGSTLVDLCRLMLDRTSAWQEVDALEGAARLTARLNLYRFLDLAETWSPLNGGPSLDAFLDYLDLLSEDESDDSLDTANISGEDAVLLATVHRAKGLEWPVVFLPALCDGFFPSRVQVYDDPETRPHVLPHHLRLDAGARPDLGDDADTRRAALRERHADQEWRTAYVAVTRAREELIASGAYWYGTGRERQPSALFSAIDVLADTEPGRCADPGEPPASLHREPRWDRVPDPLFENGWQEALSSAIHEPATASRVAAEVGIAEAFEGALDQLRLRLESLPEPLLDAHEPRPFRTSVTGMVTFAQCPQRFHWSHVDRLPRRPSPASRRGVEIHRMIERRLRGTLTFDDLEPARTAAADGATTPGDPFGRFLRSRFAADDPILVEAPFSLLIEGGRIDGRIDAVYEPDPGTWEVVDFKSGRATNDPARRVQLEAYAVAVSEAGFLGGRRPDRIRVTFAYLGGDELVETTEDVDEVWLAEARGRLAALMADASGGERTPAPSDACRRCDFARFCPAGTTWLEENG
jgi:DNA helicase II / ATP-dependent DNA helicase PcrA